MSLPHLPPMEADSLISTSASVDIDGNAKAGASVGSLVQGGGVTSFDLKLSLSRDDDSDASTAAPTSSACLLAAGSASAKTLSLRARAAAVRNCSVKDVALVPAIETATVKPPVDASVEPTVQKLKTTRPPLMEMRALRVAFLNLCGLVSASAATEKLVLRAIDLLFRCDYGSEGVCATLAHASAYVAETLRGDSKSADSEGGSAIRIHLALAIYMAHCFVEDELCPLHVWRSALFPREDDLTVKTLDAEVMRLLALRGHTLRIDQEQLDLRYAQLQAHKGSNDTVQTPNQTSLGRPGCFGWICGRS